RMRVLFVFFSSRRRHTRSKRDWSSDVCSSDLDKDKQEAYTIAKRFYDLGFQLYATEGTAKYLQERDLPVIAVAKIDEGERNVLRSEERRVGKEGRSRGAEEDVKKRKKRQQKDE